MKFCWVEFPGWNLEYSFVEVSWVEFSAHRYKNSRQSARRGELKRRKAFNSARFKRTMSVQPPTHEMHTPNRFGQGISILLVTMRGKTGGDDAESLTSQKQI